MKSGGNTLSVVPAKTGSVARDLRKHNAVNSTLRGSRMIENQAADRVEGKALRSVPDKAGTPARPMREHNRVNPTLKPSRMQSIVRGIWKFMR